MCVYIGTGTQIEPSTAAVGHVLREGYMRRRCERGATGGMPPGVLARTWAGYYALLYSSGHMTFYRDEKQVRARAPPKRW